MKKVYRSACPQDCYASCGLLIYEENGRITDIKGDPDHPLTKGKVCVKARRHLDRMYSPERILHPMKKEGSGWRRISWEEALELWAAKLLEIKERYGTTAVLHNDASGSNGILRGLGSRFFNVYGGVTVPDGCLCWGSGLAAQEIDFGGHQAHEWADLANSRTVLLWGRDPARNNPQLIEHLKSAADKGAQIISINPVRVRTWVSNMQYIQPRPGTDGALALGMAYVIINEDLVNRDFIDEYVLGFPEFSASVREFTPRRATQICGVPESDIISLARRYASKGPSAIVFGYGMQRYANAGRTVRCIDALAAITGNIGVSGGGASYVHRSWKKYFSDLAGGQYAKNGRTFPYPALARHILAADNPPVKCIVVTRSNPVTQLPDTSRAIQAFRAVDFVVVIDFFLNDTAAEADLVLPCTTFLEEEDAVVNSCNNYISYMPAVIKPLGECRSDLWIFSELAKIMGLADFGFFTTQEWLERSLAPLKPLGINLNRIKKGPVRHPEVPQVAWADRKFLTLSGKYELYAQRAVDRGLEPLPVYRSPESLQQDNNRFPLHLLTPHHRDYTHSQFWNLVSQEDLGRLPVVEMHAENAASLGLKAGDEAWVETKQGRLRCIINITGEVSLNVVRIFQGRWISQNGGINFLTPDTVSDLGNGSCYYDCRCRIYR